MHEIFDEMRVAVLEGDEDRAAELAQGAVDNGLDLVGAMDEGFLKGIQEAGELYSTGDYFLPDLVCSADAMKGALEIIRPELNKIDLKSASSGKVVVATVQGDIHDIGKTIVAAMMTAGGFEVVDLGADVDNEKVIEAVRNHEPDILALSALLTTTMEEQRNIIEALKAEGLRDKVKVMVGGAPVSQSWADQIQADGYSDDAIEAVKFAKKLLAQ